MSKRILLFPGQGSQYVGMGKKLAESSSTAKAMLARANEVLGFDLADILFNGPEAALTATEVAQPAIFTVSMMAMELVKEKGVPFDYVAGHSLGESSALCAAGAMTFEEGLAMVRTRGLLMAKAGELKPGAMCAVVGLEREKLEAVVKEASSAGVVVPANYNSLTQIVISGTREGVAQAAKLAEAAGAKKVVMLAVSGAFHSPFMEFAVPGLREALAKFSFKAPKVPVIVNVDAKPVSDPGAFAGFLLQQLTGPVRWVECMQQAQALGCTEALEVGPGKVLMGLARGISRDLKVTPVENPEDLQK
ncbi:MAG: (Acyl-carrier-protein) S-malonyltransferase [Fibrobacteres bacterium]|nr:(Acyl-carrier-protein) S-malonyltransferase [Fibrobacterota bacterium]